MPNDNHNTIFAIPRVQIGVGLALTALILVLTILYVCVPEPWKGGVLFFGAALAAAGQIAAAFYAGRTLRLVTEAEIERKKIAKEDAARELAARWTDTSMFHIKKDCHDVLDKGMQAGFDTKQYINREENRKQNISNVLNFLEELSVAVLTARADEEIAKRLFCGIVVNVWSVCGDWVRDHRMTRNRPKLWVELENLNARWR